MITDEEKEIIKKHILRVRDEGRKMWADFEASEEKKNFIADFCKMENIPVETEKCPRNLWTIIIRFK